MPPSAAARKTAYGEGARCMTHDLWSSLNVHMVDFLNSVSLQKLVDDQLAKGLTVEDKPSVKRAISAMPIKQLVRVNAPNSVLRWVTRFPKTSPPVLINF
jgi:Rrf2 family iron-sulfur cluster assembly transcriptional regulator